ncbi:hypothetical protein H6G33_04125 [Calothrix sp. FACHB-1219]|uniref:hypothetical protein n=1 Tax=unclassified Calothrix TaxID=2619626 RepID=UPI0016836885|nr:MULTISPECIES: hypothetical protein [unclassified Calothrix]MBD2204961.1 hypothetical protein [Calothrix sp. FACHB-168]MBD2216215.1 hypothetical protein [Calothrix sp. FACHB-1219]
MINNSDFPRILEIGDHVWNEIGGPVGLVIDVRRHEVQGYQEALVKYYWGDSYWFKSSELVRTRQPLTE